MKVPVAIAVDDTECVAYAVGSNVIEADEAEATARRKLEVVGVVTERVLWAEIEIPEPTAPIQVKATE